LKKTEKDSIESWIKQYADAWNRWRFFQYFFEEKDSLKGDMINEYWKFLAYEKQGTIVTIWYQGDPLSFGIADPSLNPEEREALRAKLARFQECMQDALAHLQATLGSDESLIQRAMNLLGKGVNTKDILWMLITMEIAVAKILVMEMELKRAEEAHREAGEIWEE
jgi:hypothetical protein